MPSKQAFHKRPKRISGFTMQNTSCSSSGRSLAPTASEYAVSGVDNTNTEHNNGGGSAWVQFSSYTGLINLNGTFTVYWRNSRITPKLLSRCPGLP